MAFNRQTFQTRALTAIVFAAIMLAGLLWNEWSFLVLFSIIHFGCWWEFLKLTEKIHGSAIHINSKLGLMLLGYGLLLWFCDPLYSISGYGLKENLSLPVSAAGFLLLIFGIFQNVRVNIRAFGMASLGLIYISLSWGLMIDLYQQVYEKNYPAETLYFYPVVERIIPLIIIFSIWINDTMAYIVGSLIGKTALSPISPKKTWEGTVGGIILAIVVMGMVNLHAFGLLKIKPHYHWFVIPAIAAIAGTFGDLLESKIKRVAGVKDSGSLMPGHGGFLDRFDSLLLATPFVWIYVQLFIS